MWVEQMNKEISENLLTQTKELKALLRDSLKRKNYNAVKFSLRLLFCVRNLMKV